MPESLTERHVVIETETGDVTFDIRKLLPMEAYRVLEIIRPSLQHGLEILRPNLQGMMGQARDEADEAGGDTLKLTFVDIAMVLTVLPPEMVERVRRQLFAQVFFKSPNIPVFECLAGHEDAAFQHLDAIYVYEIEARAVAVNFTESWAVIQSRFMSGSPDTLLSELGI